MDNEAIALDAVRRYVWSGFYDVGEVAEIITESIFWRGEIDQSWLRDEIENAFRQKRAEEGHGPRSPTATGWTAYSRRWRNKASCRCRTPATRSPTGWQMRLSSTTRLAENGQVSRDSVSTTAKTLNGSWRAGNCCSRSVMSTARMSRRRRDRPPDQAGLRRGRVHCGVGRVNQHAVVGQEHPVAAKGEQSLTSRPTNSAPLTAATVFPPGR